MGQSNRDTPSKILVVDDDHDTAGLMQAVLTDEGYAPSVIYGADSKSVGEAVTRLTPDCVLLDSSKEDSSQYGESWQTAARIAAGERNIPVIMMTGHAADADEAVAGTSKRARAADFASVIRKPFDLDEFLTHSAMSSTREQPGERPRLISPSACRIFGSASWPPELAT